MGQLVTFTPTRPVNAAGTLNLGSVAPVKIGSILPIQVMGFVPMHECGISDCRVINTINCCFRNIVFGNVVDGIADINTNYKNDWSVFSMDYQLYANNPSASANWKLEKCVQNSDAIIEG